MPNNLTDKEIKKALEEYINFADLEYINHTSIEVDILKNALDLIKRLQAEKNELKDTIKVLRVDVEQAHIIRKDGKSPFNLLKAEIKAEAYKECIEKVKAHYKECQFEYDYSNTCETLNNIYKELVGEDNSHNIDKQN